MTPLNQPKSLDESDKLPGRLVVRRWLLVAIGIVTAGWLITLGIQQLRLRSAAMRGVATCTVLAESEVLSLKGGDGCLVGYVRNVSGDIRYTCIRISPSSISRNLPEWLEDAVAFWGLKQVRVEGMTIEVDQLNALLCSSELTSLTLVDCQVTTSTKIKTRVGSKSALSNVVFVDCRVYSNEEMCLQGASRISLLNSVLSDAQLIAISRSATSVTSFSSDSPMPSTAVCELLGRSTLRSIDLSRQDFSNAASMLGPLGLKSRLTSLILRDCVSNESIVAIVRNCTTLEHCILEGRSASIGVLIALSSSKDSLTELMVVGMQVDDDSLRQIGTFPELGRLLLRDTSISSEKLKIFSETFRGVIVGEDEKQNTMRGNK